MIHNHHLSTI